jgi:hypothetical protein
MQYTTHGLMTPADIADHEALTDTGRNPECPGHPDEDGWKGDPFGVTYCSRAENCPDANEADEWEEPPGLEPM